MTENEDNIVPEPTTVTPPAMHMPPPPPQLYATQENKSGKNTVIVMAILFLIGALTSLAGLSKLSQISAQYFYLNLAYTIVYAIASAAVAIGLFQFRASARVGAIYLLIFRAAAGIPLSYLALANLPPDLSLHETGKGILMVIMTISTIIVLSVIATMIYFLTRPAVKEACNR